MEIRSPFPIIPCVLSFFMVSSPIEGCPALVSTGQLTAMTGLPLDQIRYVFNEKGTLRVSHADALHLAGDGRVSVPGPPTVNHRLSNSDIFVIPSRLGGPAVPRPLLTAECPNGHVWAVNWEGAGKVTYLTNCPIPLSEDRRSSSLTHDTERHRIGTPLYEVSYHPNHPLMFSSIRLRNGYWGESQDLMAELSAQLMRLNMRNFFDLYFDDDDVEAEIAAIDKGLYSIRARLKFYFKILFFRIDMELYPDIFFFEDAIYMPMVMTMPVNAAEYVNKGSGMSYTFFTDPSVVQWSDPQALKVSDVLDQANPVDKSFEDVYRFCRGLNCSFSLSGKVKGRHFSLTFNLDRTLVDLDFYPLYIENAALDSQKLGFPLDQIGKPGRRGFFFSASKLPAGEHKWDFWIGLNDRADDSCPARIETSMIK